MKDFFLKLLMAIIFIGGIILTVYFWVLALS